MRGYSGKPDVLSVSTNIEGDINYSGPVDFADYDGKAISSNYSASTRLNPLSTDRPRRQNGTTMLRTVMISAIFFAFAANSASAQIPGNLGSGASEAAPSAAPAAAAGGNKVTITNKCCSIWDKLGIAEIGKLVGGIFKLPIFRLMEGTVLGPLASVTGLDPNDPTAQHGAARGAGGGGGPGGAAGAGGAGGGAPPSAGATAAALAAKKKAVKAEVAAIRFLANENCLCYPEIVDALIAALDDCAEPVRYAALKALRKGCGSNGCLPCETGNCDPRTQFSCPNCQCQTKVLSRLSDLLLVRDVHNQYKERSRRVRQLSRAMISECLARRPVSLPGAPRRESRAQPDPTPLAVPTPPSPGLSGKQGPNNTTQIRRSQLPTVSTNRVRYRKTIQIGSRPRRTVKRANND